jgi:ABC-2 type transport system ATP-binding protein
MPSSVRKRRPSGQDDDHLLVATMEVKRRAVPSGIVLFLDEPTTGLDPYSRNEVWAMIGELVDDGTTVVLTTQYLEEADRLASRVAVIDEGRVIANDPPAQLKARLGSTVIEIGLADAPTAKRAHALLASRSTLAPELENSTVRLTTHEAHACSSTRCVRSTAKRSSPPR